MESHDKKIARIYQRSKKQKTIDKNVSIAMEKTIQSINEKQKVFIKSIQSKFTVSPIDVISDWLSCWGIKLVKLGKSEIGRFYKMDLSLFEKLTGFSGTKPRNSLYIGDFTVMENGQF